ncbi:hypothetical protein F0160_00055 [Paraburkholderia sp. JPY303]|nr:hypothetical protein [Paraburkholderia atlantica]
MWANLASRGRRVRERSGLSVSIAKHGWETVIAHLTAHPGALQARRMRRHEHPRVPEPMPATDMQPEQQPVRDTPDVQAPGSAPPCRATPASTCPFHATHPSGGTK